MAPGAERFKWRFPVYESVLFQYQGMTQSLYGPGSYEVILRSWDDKERTFADMQNLGGQERDGSLVGPPHDTVSSRTDWCFECIGQRLPMQDEWCKFLQPRRTLAKAPAPGAEPVVSEPVVFAPARQTFSVAPDLGGE